MTPEERKAKHDEAQARHEDLFDAMHGGKQYPEHVMGLDVDDTWTQETARALDVSDAQDAGFRDPMRDELRSLSDVTRTASQYTKDLTRFLGHMQDLLIESISDIEVLQHNWQRLR